MRALLVWNTAPRWQAAWWRTGRDAGASGAEHRLTETSSAVAFAAMPDTANRILGRWRLHAILWRGTLMFVMVGRRSTRPWWQTNSHSAAVTSDRAGDAGAELEMQGSGGLRAFEVDGPGPPPRDPCRYPTNCDARQTFQANGTADRMVSQRVFDRPNTCHPRVQPNIQ
jgi:hypothetical protein